MTDNLSPDVRSYNMSRIHSKNTKPEELVLKYLFSKGLRYRRYDKRYPGKPDAIFPKYHVALFINGCFWHSHENCPKFVIPKSNLEYWKPKLERNRHRDKINYEALTIMGWRVIIIWECELKSSVCEERLERLYSEIVNSK